MSRYSRLGWSLLVGGLAFTLGATTASAQGQRKGHEKQEARERSDGDHDRHDHAPPGQAKKHYTPVQAVSVTRDVMHRHGYEVTRVERHGDDQVIYYYRGNMGRGRGHGPVERMVIHPDHERLIVRQAPPSPVWAELRAALGL